MYPEDAVKWIARARAAGVDTYQYENTTEGWDSLKDEIVKSERKLAKEQADARTTMDVHAHMQACFNVPLEAAR